MRSLLLSTSLLWAAACSTSIDAAHYPATCAVDTDCVAVFSGELCQVCGGCPNAAIAASEQARYEADQKALAGRCPPRLGPQPACSPCLQRAAVCDAGVCQPGPQR